MGCAAKGIFNSEGKTAGGTPWMGRERVPREMDDATGSARVGKAQRVRVLRVRASALRFLSRGKRSACSQGDHNQRAQSVVQSEVGEDGATRQRARTADASGASGDAVLAPGVFSRLTLAPQEEGAALPHQLRTRAMLCPSVR